VSSSGVSSSCVFFSGLSRGVRATSNRCSSNALCKGVRRRYWAAVM
jgi:hypothetical protein